MSRDQFNPPRLAVWLLQHLSAAKNKEALSGDLLEQFRERRSAIWFWKQVLIAIAVGGRTELRLHWPEICFAIAGSVTMGFIGKTISGSPGMVRWWMLSRSLDWPLPSIVFDLSRAALLAAAVLPVLSIFLTMNKTFGWDCLLRAFRIIFAGIAIGDGATLLWLSSHPEIIQRPSMLLNIFGVARIFFTLLLSAWLSCRSRPSAA